MRLGDDIDAMLADFGVPVTAGGLTANALHDAADEMLLQNGSPAGVIGKQIVLLIRTGTLAVKPGASLTIAGAPHTAREVYQLDDGMLTRIICAKA